jgi:nitronate monooxygenase
MLDVALEEGAPVVVLSFGDPAPYARKVKDGGARLICQVQRVEEAVQAADLGSDAIIAQGTEAGGHTGRVSTLPFVPQVVDAVPGVPVAAAGGIADGRGLAAALALGAAGVAMGTRFVASREADTSEGVRRRIVQAGASDTVLTEVFDIAMRIPWPEGIAGRAIRSSFSDRWHGREDDLRANLGSLDPAVKEALQRRDPNVGPVYAGEVSGLVRGVESAGEIVRRVIAEAESVIRDRLAPTVTAR